jgi:hypothetical protein
MVAFNVNTPLYILLRPVGNKYSLAAIGVIHTTVCSRTINTQRKARD